MKMLEGCPGYLHPTFKYTGQIILENPGTGFTSLATRGIANWGNPAPMARRIVFGGQELARTAHLILGRATLKAVLNLSVCAKE